jgi:hypothetical protein
MRVGIPIRQSFGTSIAAPPELPVFNRRRREVAVGSNFGNDSFRCRQRELSGCSRVAEDQDRISKVRPRRTPRSVIGGSNRRNVLVRLTYRQRSGICSAGISDNARSRD